MTRRGLTSADARARVKEFISERYRRVRSSIGLGKTRRSSTTKALVAGTNSYSLTSTAKVLTVYDDTNRKTLREITMDQIRALDPGLEQESSSPDFYAIESVGASSVGIFIWPTPTDTQTLSIDILSLVTELSADGDIPVFPEDFHDVLVYGALADEYAHAEKAPLKRQYEDDFKERMRDLRFFIAKSRWLALHQGATDLQYSRLGPNYEANR